MSASGPSSPLVKYIEFIHRTSLITFEIVNNTVAN